MAIMRSNSIGTQEWLNVTRGVEITSCDYSFMPTATGTTAPVAVQIFVGYPAQDAGQLLPLEYEVP